jgi:hypothetical protein
MEDEPVGAMEMGCIIFAAPFFITILILSILVIIA